uniref:Uncharacterized protein n=1 Tax=Picea sitchensis TaxID=3332 RepID=A9NSG4_PICSI|nr:unknown [Picea sitchensis]
MLSLSVVRSLVLRDETVEHVNSIAKASSLLYLSKQLPRWRRINGTNACNNTRVDNGGFPYLVFVPTEEVMRDALRVAAIARDIGMEFCGDLINDRLIYSWPALGMAAHESISLPFPRLGDAHLQELNEFANLSRGFFRVENLSLPLPPCNSYSNSHSNSRRGRERGSGSLGVTLNKELIDSMDKFTRVMAGAGWSMFKLKSTEEMYYVYRKVDFKLRLQWDGLNPSPAPAFRARELRLPDLNLTSAPTEILEYVLLMTDDLFYLNHKPPCTSSRRSSSSSFPAYKMKS